MKWRVPAGFVRAPIVPCALYATAMSVIASQWSGFRFIVVAMVTVSEALCLFVALPLFLVLRRFRAIALLECVGAGVAITILVNVISLLVSGGPGYSAGDGASADHGSRRRDGMASGSLAGYEGLFRAGVVCRFAEE